MMNVLALQMLPAAGFEGNCSDSNISCASHQSCRSNASCVSQQSDPVPEVQFLD